MLKYQTLNLLVICQFLPFFSSFHKCHIGIVIVLAGYLLFWIFTLLNFVDYMNDYNISEFMDLGYIFNTFVSEFIELLICAY